MKQLYIILLLISSIGNCIAVDTLGLTDTYKGDVAKKKLLDAARTADFVMATAAFTEQGFTSPKLEQYIIADVIIASLIDEGVFGIDESKYYKKKDVDDCAQVIQFGGLIIGDDSFTTFASNRTCRLSPNEQLIDKNIGKSSNR
ncbi:TIGR04452 family lipoprotein [Leptospira sarikeiensis]|uniref:TIGR04452 family lipoprotein n=1 Tax=Leptospira sarikeiensis TaxID=2484943 RepID=A0A4R9KED7_9LEPT|nr:TIGR04452 family lipoprotein [Leptospira sarikeiensis]TGL64636.1 TIGR04452 family lipoprotein [Leptospira sarikeiensis]